MALNSLWQRLRWLDQLIVAGLLILCAILFFVAGVRKPGQEIYVERDGTVIFRAPLSDNRKVELQGPLGTTVLEIVSGQARITSSPCPFKVCIGMGEISHSGEILACVPNRLLVQVVGPGETIKEQEYDLLSR